MYQSGVEGEKNIDSIDQFMLNHYKLLNKIINLLITNAIIYEYVHICIFYTYILF